MKRILIQAILLIASVAVHAQTQLKPLPLSNYSLGGTTLSFSDTTLWAKQEQSTFFLGWHWIGPKKQANKLNYVCSK